MSEDRLDAVQSDLRAAVASMRARNTQFYRDFLAIQDAPAGEGQVGVTMPVRVQHSGAGGFISPGVLGTLADIVLAAALRRQVEERNRLLTVGLTLQTLGEQRAERIHAAGETVSVTDQTGIARCRMADQNGVLLAMASGTFAVRPVAEGALWLASGGGEPLAASEIASVDLDHLTREEQWLRNRVETGLRGDGANGPYAGFLGIRWRKQGAGRVEGSWPLGPHLWNRSGNVHGGALFGALAEAALACLPADLPKQVMEQHVQFVRPGRGDRLTVEARLLRRGQQLTSVHATIVDADNHSIASALVTIENGRVQQAHGDGS